MKTRVRFLLLSNCFSFASNSTLNLFNKYLIRFSLTYLFQFVSHQTHWCSSKQCNWFLCNEFPLISARCRSNDNLYGKPDSDPTRYHYAPSLNVRFELELTLNRGKTRRARTATFHSIWQLNERTEFLRGLRLLFFLSFSFILFFCFKSYFLNLPHNEKFLILFKIFLLF